MTPSTALIICARAPIYVGTSRLQQLAVLAVPRGDAHFCSWCGARVKVVA